MVAILLFGTLGVPVYAKTAKAEGVYLRVITEDTPFFKSTTDTEPLFYLTYTYYVKVIGYEKEYVHVEISNGKLTTLDGYVPKDMLYHDDLTVTDPYPEVIITTSSASLNTALYTTTELKTVSRFIFAEKDVYFFGKTKSSSGETLYFVNYLDNLGYVKESCVMPFKIENHPNELTFIKTEPDAMPQDNNSPTTPTQQESPINGKLQSETETLRWVVIGCLGFAGIIALIITISKRPAKVKRMDDYFEENDFQ